MREIWWQILYWGWVLGEIWVLVATKTRSGGGEVRDRGSLRILWLVILVSVTVAIWYGSTHEPTMFGGASWVKSLAVVLLAVALVIRWTAIVTLGKSFSANVAIHARQKVYKRGIFSVVRHPSYTGLMLVFVAIGIHTRNWGAFAFAVVPTFAAMAYRIRVEEIALREAFGEQYAEYSRTTKRLVPGIY